MNCTINDVIIAFDKDNRLRNTIARVSKYDINKAYVLASFLSDEKFKEYFIKNVNSSNVLKDETVDFNNIQQEDYLKINQNKLGEVLNAYYLDTYHSVENSRTNKQSGRLSGFTSGEAKKVAKNHTADYIIIEYDKERNQPSNKRRKPEQIIADAFNKILKEFYDGYVVPFIAEIENSKDFSQEAKDYAQKVKDSIKKANEVKEELKTIAADYKDKKNKYNAAKVAGKKAVDENNKELADSLLKEAKQLSEELPKLKAKYDELKTKKAYAERNQYVLAQNLINYYIKEYKSSNKERILNMANLVSQTRGDTNGWYFLVKNTKKMTNIIKDFSSINEISILEDEEEYDDAETKVDKSVDTMSQHWEDSLYRTFTKAVDGRIRLILGSLPKLSSPFNPTSQEQAYDRNNPLGCITYNDFQYLTVQIFTYGNVSSVDAFIASIEEKANSIPELYSLGILVNQMKKNPVFANFMFANFNKPHIKKAILNINNISQEDGIVFEHSNPRSDAKTETIYRFLNHVRHTNIFFSKEDLTELQQLINSYNNKGNVSIIQTKLTPILIKYFPTLNKSVINSYFKQNKNDLLNNKDTGLNKLLIATRDLLSKFENYNAEEENKDIIKSVISIATELYKFSESKVKLNTSNAAGNTSSDIGKNSYVTRLFDQILSGTKKNELAGLIALGKYITQGANNGKYNQYANNPLFFGVRDINGRVVVEGMFNRVNNPNPIDPTVDNYIQINPNAKRILNYYLYDGTKNNINNKGVLYKTMSKLDFFISLYKMFEQSLPEFTNDGQTTKINGVQTAIYPMRIGSDAPKIYLIRGPRYDGKNTLNAIYNHLIADINKMVIGINGIFENAGGDKYISKTNTFNLFERAHFNKAIVENGRLSGNLFKFRRLFDTNNYSPNAEVEKALLLYGGEDINPLFISLPDGNLRLNTNRTDIIKYDAKTGQFVLNLSNELKMQLYHIATTWMNEFAKEIDTNTRDFITVMQNNNIPFNNKVLKAFIFNAAVMNMNYDDLFEGDFVYYKNARDFLKRTKESQAGGDSYAGFDLNKDETKNGITDLTDENGNTSKYAINVKTNSKTNEMKQLEIPTFGVNGISNKPMTARNGFRAVTVVNTNKTSDMAPEIANELKEQYIKEGRNPEEAEERANKYAHGFGAAYDKDNSKDQTITTINDAQSYITLEEFIRRRYADGTINEYQDLLAQLLDDTDAFDINLDAINSRIQVQKNFYFDKPYDAITGLYRPRQIKNAEFVLIPKLLPKDSKLRKVYDFMIKHDIGQLNTVETSKAAKRNPLTIWDAKTGEFNENFEDTFKEEQVENYFYKFLYKQQDVPQHIEDAKNKAGIQIVKKIIDNVFNDIPNDKIHENVQKWAKEYMSAFASNVKEDFYTFLDNMGWSFDTKLNRIVNKVFATTDSEGNELPIDEIEYNKQHLNFSRFYQRAREEAARLGEDENFMEYLTPDAFGNPIMPNCMNNKTFKLESIAQAVFNSKITRQTLPGWHAAQITAVGYSKKLKYHPTIYSFEGKEITAEDYKKLSEEDRKNATVVHESYMEVYLPRWSKLIPKCKNAEEEQELIKQIEKEGLDIHLGYRIPTEGKQSISILKVVGFTHDCLGSTVVVPEEWVTQTGSDFDVDSVYGICFEMYKYEDENGKVHLKKIPYERKDTDDRNLYINYIKNRTKQSINKDDLKQVIDDDKNRIFNELNNTDERNKYSEQVIELNAERGKLISAVDRKVKTIIYKHKNLRLQQDPEHTAESLITQLKNTNAELNKRKKVLAKTDEDKTNIDALIKNQEQMITILKAQLSIPVFDINEFGNKVANKALDEYVAYVESKAKEQGLESFEEFKKFDYVDKLSREARNNYIIDRMIKILSDVSSKEEQYGKSKFNNLGDANKNIDVKSGDSARNRSPYNPLDQIDYFEDAMGGARLKAQSVNWDTFCSKNNIIRTSLSDEHAVIIEFPYDDDLYKRLFKSYGKDVEKVEIDNDLSQDTPRREIIRFTARNIGWSIDNLNMDGELITSYSSQTTAQILDAIKEGSIPNVNAFTFDVYKILASIGLDYAHVISFMRQPAMYRIVNEYNLKESVFVSDSVNVINQALASVIYDLGQAKKDISLDYPSIDNILNAIKGIKPDKNNKNKKNKENTEENAEENTEEDKNVDSLVKAFKRLYNIDINKMSNEEILNYKFPIRKQWLEQRIKTAGQNKLHLNPNDANIFNEAAIDIVGIITFNQIYQTGRRINDVIKVTGADKFGAKNTIRETREIEHLVEELRNDDILTKNGKTFIDLIYPKNILGEIDVNSSSYKTIAAAYKYATLPSLNVNSKLFVTENNDYARLLAEVERIIGKKLNTEEYKEYKRYLIANLYNQMPQFTYPLSVDKRGNIIIDDVARSIYSDGNLQYWQEEILRIFGYGIPTDTALTIKDINNPTTEEIAEFVKLTPAQKVSFIQRNFDDNKGIFEYINTTFSNPYDLLKKGITRQYLAYNDQLDSIDDLRSLFEVSFFNKNPLIKLAAIDLIKYSYIAEADDFKSGYISKIMSNTTLYTNIDEGGMDVIDNNGGIRQSVHYLPNILQNEDFYNKYIRSHSELIRTIRIKDSKEEGFNMGNALNTVTKNGLVYLSLRSINPHSKTGSIFQYLFDKIKPDYYVGRYIKLDRETEKGRQVILYKVIGFNPVSNDGNKITYKDYYLIPQNLLDSNEVSDISYNNKNNNFATEGDYETAITNHQTAIQNIERSKKEEKDKRNGINISLFLNSVDFAPNNPKLKQENTHFNLNENPNVLLELSKGKAIGFANGINKLFDKINEFYSIPENITESIVVYNPSYELNTLINRNQKVLQNVPMKDGSVKPFTIFRINQFGIAKEIETIKAGKKDRFLEAPLKEVPDNAPLTMVNLYKITPVDESKENVKYAATELIDLSDEVDDHQEDVIKLSISILNEAAYNARKDNIRAKQFLKTMQDRNVNRNLSASIVENKNIIYRGAARYYTSIADSITNKLNNFVINGKSYSMDDPELYEVLKDHEEYFNEIAYTLLDGITFGNRIKDIMSLDITAEDAEMQKEINNIRNAINRVRNNIKLRKAMDNLINIYFKKYSNNPDIKNDLIKIRDQFGDTDFINSWIIDPAEIDNNEVQIILKHVYDMFNKAEMFTAKENVAKFKKDLAEIKSMPEVLDINKVIDFDNFALRPRYNENFIKDRDELRERLKIAKTNGIDTLEYIKAKLAYDEFNYKYTEQPILPEYYEKEIAYRKEVIDKAGDLYVQYMSLIHKLYDNNNTKDDKAKIQAQLRELTNIGIENGRVKSKEEIDKINAINKFVKNIKELKQKYFDTVEYDGFKNSYEYHKNVVDTYDRQHSQETLDVKLTNHEYQESYNWLKENGRSGFTNEGNKLLKKAFKDLVSRTTALSKQTLDLVNSTPDAIDENGNIDASKLTLDQLKMLRKEQANIYQNLYDNRLGEAMLIKDTPSNLPVADKSLYANKEELSFTDNDRKFAIIGRINEIISKATDAFNGHISSAILFDNNIVSNEEREELIILYNELNTLRKSEYLAKRKEAYKNKLAGKKKNGIKYEELVNDEAYNTEKEYYDANLKNTAQGRQWLAIFTDLNNEGELIPNPNIYNYIIPQEDYIDEKKTNARNFIQDNVEFILTDAYYIAKKEAETKGSDYYKEWYDINHVYNPYSHKIEPLRVWTTLVAKPNSKLAEEVTFIPSYNNTEKFVKKEFLNNEENRKRVGLKGKGYTEFGDNYKDSEKYNTELTLNDKEKALRNLIQETLNKYAITYKGKRFVGKGYLPRERKEEINAQYAIEQIGSLAGISFKSSGESDSYRSDFNYNDDIEPEFKMLTPLKARGTQKYIPIPIRNKNESPEDYDKRVAEVREQNKKIEKSNQSIDAQYVNKNWEQVLEDYVHNATIFNSRQEAKPYLYLLLEDLKNNEAYKLKGIWNKKVQHDSRNSISDKENYVKEEQKNTYEVVHNLVQRLLFDEYHEVGKFRTFANFLQNLTSAKYMVFNLYGGIANVTTGKANIAMEAFANEYFSFADLKDAEKEYFSNYLGLGYITNMYTDKSTNLPEAIIKRFNVVDFDQVLQFGAGSENLDEKLKRIRNFTYGFQTAGEHYMQNTVLFAMMKSHRVYTDSEGKKVIGNFSDFTRDIEDKAMLKTLENNEELLRNYKGFKGTIKYNVKEKLNIILGRSNINKMFLHSLKKFGDKDSEQLYKKLAKSFRKNVNDLMKDAKNKFYNENNPTVKQLFELKDGYAELIPIDKPNALWNKDIEENLISEFKGKVIRVNTKIHGTYDKIGAAMLEKKWFGSIVMQYHKHLPTGIRKRWRRKGYYSEFRNTRERGTKQTLIDFLTTEFIDYNQVVKDMSTKKDKNGKPILDANGKVIQENVVMNSIQVAIMQALNTIYFINANWNILSEWERANILRNLGDTAGVLSACLLVIGMYSLWDDDDIKDDGLKASALYLADRLYSDSTMYSPIGLVTEYKNNWSSPVASATGPSDLIKAATLIPQAIFDPDYQAEYSTGQYAHKNKLEILFRRNIPGVRPYDRIQFITTNNKYYKVGESQIGINIAKTFGEWLYNS